MASVGKHVHAGQRAQREPRRRQATHVPGEGRDVARDIDHAGRLQRGQTLDDGPREAGPRRIDDDRPLEARRARGQIVLHRSRHDLHRARAGRHVQPEVPQRVRVALHGRDGVSPERCRRDREQPDPRIQIDDRPGTEPAAHRLDQAGEQIPVGLEEGRRPADDGPGDAWSPHHHLERIGDDRRTSDQAQSPRLTHPRRHAGDIGNLGLRTPPLDDAPGCRRPQLVVEHPLGRGDVLGDLHMLHEPPGRAVETTAHLLDDALGRRLELSRPHHAADVVRALPAEPQTRSPEVQPGPQPISLLGGRQHHEGLGGGDLAEPAEGVAYRLGLQPALPGVRDVTIDLPATRRIVPRGSPVGVGREHLNVALIDLRATPIERILANGLRTSGAEYELDVLVLATGFDANTGGLTAIDIRGRDNLSLAEAWSDGVDTHLGVAVPGFPNMLMLYGPQSATAFCNGPTCAEFQGDWVTRLLMRMRAQGHSLVETTAEMGAAWTAHLAEMAETTLFGRTDSWYMGANIPGKRRQLLNYPNSDTYRERLWDCEANGYDGFVFG